VTQICIVECLNVRNNGGSSANSREFEGEIQFVKVINVFNKSSSQRKFESGGSVWTKKIQAIPTLPEKIFQRVSGNVTADNQEKSVVPSSRVNSLASVEES
ncbi:hypothetical protein BB558_006116, partial [Smittium angustum]